MKIVTLFENSDLAMARVIDKYLSQLVRQGGLERWNIEDVKPGEVRKEVIREQIRQADLVIVLVSQDFLADPECYGYALDAFNQHPPAAPKKVVAVLLRPNNLEITPLRDLPQLPAQNRWITGYRDPEQGYWEVYQGLKKVIDPDHHYKKRPKLVTLQGTVIGSSMLLLWSFLVLVLPWLFPETGLKIVQEPFLTQPNSLYYKIYKLDNTAQPGTVLSFMLPASDTASYGDLQPVSKLMKSGDDNWVFDHTSTLDPAPWLINEQGQYFSQCVSADFREGDAGEYHFLVEFSRPVSESLLAGLAGKLTCSHAPCSELSSNCGKVGPFSLIHYCYRQPFQFCTVILVFILITLLLAAAFITKKISAYAQPDHRD